MKRIIIDLFDDYSQMITFTAIGGHPMSVNVFTTAVDLTKGTKLTMCKTDDGVRIEQEE